MEFIGQFIFNFGSHELVEYIRGFFSFDFYKNRIFVFFYVRTFVFCSKNFIAE